MTGMTGATGMHSLSSVATAQAKNANACIPMSIGGGDDMSVMTGVSAATQQVTNRGRVGIGRPMGGMAVPVGNEDDAMSVDFSVMTGVSAATRQAGNLPGGMGLNMPTTNTSPTSNSPGFGASDSGSGGAPAFAMF